MLYLSIFTKIIYFPVSNSCCALFLSIILFQNEILCKKHLSMKTLLKILQNYIKICLCNQIFIIIVLLSVK